MHFPDRRHTGKRAPSSSGCWVKSKPFTIHVGPLMSVSYQLSHKNVAGNSWNSWSLANGSTIDTFGTKTIPLDLGLRKFKWSFVLADVNHPMLGADCFCSSHLFTDIYTSHIIDTETNENILVGCGTAPAPRLNTCT